jgi:hypothetical protein
VIVATGKTFLVYPQQIPDRVMVRFQDRKPVTGRYRPD